MWTIHDKFFFTFFFKSVGKHLKSVGGRRHKKSVELSCMRQGYIYDVLVCNVEYRLRKGKDM
jgi:hypothetical protein